MTHKLYPTLRKRKLSFTVISSLLSGCIVELNVDLAILPCLSPVFAVGSSFVSLIVNLCAESVSELFCIAAALLAEIMAISEVLAQVRVVAIGQK